MTEWLLGHLQREMMASEAQAYSVGMKTMGLLSSILLLVFPKERTVLTFEMMNTPTVKAQVEEGPVKCMFSSLG